MIRNEDIPVKEYIYKHIRNLILSGQLKPGEKIPEAQLSMELNVSKTPVRDAVRKLSWDGLVELHTNKTATVRILDEETIKELALVRWHLDKLNMPLLMYNVNNRSLDELEKMADECIAYNEQGDLNTRNRMDARFHLKLYEIGGNNILISIHHYTEQLVRLWQATYVINTEFQTQYLKQHQELIQLLRHSDADGALALLYDHYSSAYGFDIDQLLPALPLKKE